MRLNILKKQWILKISNKIQLVMAFLKEKWNTWMSMLNGDDDDISLR